ncbi:MAG TPA: GAF domain-containing protein [Anaerolineae bacterium]|jgi:signal transduction histidine kinase
MTIKTAPSPHQVNLERLLRQQESLRQVIESISGELELQPLLTRIIQHACELIEADMGAIGLIDGERQVIRTEAVYRMPPDELGSEMPPGVGLAGRVFLTQQPVILERYGDLEQPTRTDLAEFAAMGIPIVWRGQMVGYFSIEAAPPRQFEAPDAERLALFARHAAIAIENARLFAGTQARLQETQLLYQTSRRISTALSIDDVITAYLEQVALQGRYACSVVLYEFNPAGQRQNIILVGRWTADEGLHLPGERYPYIHDALDPPLDVGETVTMADVHTDPRASAQLRQIQAESNRPALAMIPLMVRGERIGLVILSAPHVYEWHKIDLQPYQVTATQLAATIDSRRQHQLLYQRGQQVAVLQERQRLARDLHDSVTQLIFSMTLIAQSISPAWQRDPAEGERRVARLLELSQAALAEMREFLAELRPANQEPVVTEALGSVGFPALGLLQIQQEGLALALQKHITHIVGEDLYVEIDLHNYAKQPPAVEAALYRIAQEALNNIVKHAHAQHVEIRLVTDHDFTRLTVTDDGIGFSRDAADHSEIQSGVRPGTIGSRPTTAQAGGFGLATMRERAEALGGTMQLIAKPGQGTTVMVELPVR